MAYKIVRKGEWYYDVLSQALRKWTKNVPLQVFKGRGLDKLSANAQDEERLLGPLKE